MVTSMVLRVFFFHKLIGQSAANFTAHSVFRTKNEGGCDTKKQDGMLKNANVTNSKTKANVPGLVLGGTSHVWKKAPLEMPPDN